MIVDAQIHLWKANSPERPWPPERAAGAHGASLDAETMRSWMAEAGVHRAVIVPPSWEGDRNDVALDAVARYPETFAETDLLIDLARRPNVAVKASAVARYTTESYPYPVAQQRLRRILDAFGSQRFFWGSDISSLPCTYRQAVTLFTDELPWLSAADQKLVMGQGICNWLGWKF